MVNRRVYFLLLVLLAGACASTPSPEAMAILEADEAAVERCSFLAHVSGSSMLGGAVQRRARENARASALDDAAKLGATHIVWSSVESTVTNGARAQGRAYRCATSRPEKTVPS